MSDPIKPVQPTTPVDPNPQPKREQPEPPKKPGEKSDFEKELEKVESIKEFDRQQEAKRADEARSDANRASLTETLKKFTLFVLDSYDEGMACDLGSSTPAEFIQQCAEAFCGQDESEFHEEIAKAGGK